MFVSQDKLADEKRGACRAVGLAKADFFTEPKNVCIAKWFREEASDSVKAKGHAKRI